MPDNNPSHWTGAYSNWAQGIPFYFMKFIQPSAMKGLNNADSMQPQFTIADNQNPQNHVGYSKGKMQERGAQMDVHNMGQHIVNLGKDAKGSQITQIIMQMENYLTESNKDSTTVNLMHRLRTELNTPDFNNIMSDTNNGIVKTLTGLLQGNMSGLSGLGNLGQLQSILSAVQAQSSAGQSQNNVAQAAVANNQLVDASGNTVVAQVT